MLETHAPFREQNWGDLGEEQPFEEEAGAARGEAVLDIIGEARKGVGVQDIMGVGAEGGYEVVAVRRGHSLGFEGLWVFSELSDEICWVLGVIGKSSLGLKFFILSLFKEVRWQSYRILWPKLLGRRSILWGFLMEVFTIRNKTWVVQLFAWQDNFSLLAGSSLLIWTILLHY